MMHGQRNINSLRKVTIGF